MAQLPLGIDLLLGMFWLNPWKKRTLTRRDLASPGANRFSLPDMASTAQTSWTNQTVDMLKNAHVECKPILKNLVDGTLEKGIRFISQQTKATEGKRHLRLDAWYYIRRVNSDEVLKAIRDANMMTEELLCLTIETNTLEPVTTGK